MSCLHRHRHHHSLINQYHCLFFLHLQDSTEQSQWHIQTENTSSLVQLLAAIKRPWQEMFGVELKQTIHPSVTVQVGETVTL